MRTSAFIVLVLFLSACSVNFKYSQYSCLKNIDSKSSWFNQYAVVEGFGTVNENRISDGYVLSFPYYEADSIIFEKDYVESNTLQVEPGECGREN